jgi:hypothetical protein
MKRFFLQLKKTHPRLPFLIDCDSLFAHSPTITFINSLKLNYLMTCKQGDHKYMYGWLNDLLSGLGRSSRAHKVRLRVIAGVMMFP